jgi:ribonuclease Z
MPWLHSVFTPIGSFPRLASDLLPTLLSSQNMGVTPTEVPSISPPTRAAKPKPTYTDKNITVYSIPLFPRVDGNGGSLHSRSQEDSSSKRKRRASSASPPRRNEDLEFSAETRNLPLTERMRLNGFVPTNLVGKDAEDWREMTVSGMFPAKKPKPGMGSDAGIDADPPYVSTFRRHPGSFDPAGSDKQLPRMNLTKDSEPITSKQKPSLAYIVLGPKTRGKLDAKKADELGLKAKLRGLVASGNTVTFTTTDANGKQIERTVKPEECVGPGENPAVGTEIITFSHLEVTYKGSRQVMIILDIPTVAHIPAVVSAFTESDFYAKFRSRKTEDRIELLTNVVYHLCGPNVIEDPRYQAFMRGFNSNVYVCSLPPVLPIV